jgi:hypothetical protein
MTFKSAHITNFVTSAVDLKYFLSDNSRNQGNRSFSDFELLEKASANKKNFNVKKFQMRQANNPKLVICADLKVIYLSILHKFKHSFRILAQYGSKKSKATWNQKKSG